MVILAAQIGQQTASMSDQFEQTTAGTLIVFIDPQVLGETFDAGGQNRNLNLWRACILAMLFVLLNNFVLTSLSKAMTLLLLKY